MLTDPHDGTQDDREDRDLDAEQQASERHAALHDGDVQPADQQHQAEAGQHETEAGEQPADPPARQHAEMDAEFVRLGAGQDLQHGKQPVEPALVDPAFLLDQRLPQHRDLRDRAAEGETAEAQEFAE